MNAIADATEALAAAARTVPGVEVSTNPAVALNLPTVLIGPPSLTFDGFPVEPTDATFHVFVIVALDRYAVEKLRDLVPQVAAALDVGTDGVVRNADPTVYPSGAKDLPAYEIICEVPL